MVVNHDQQFKADVLISNGLIERVQPDMQVGVSSEWIRSAIMAHAEMGANLLAAALPAP